MKRIALRPLALVLIWCLSVPSFGQNGQIKTVGGRKIDSVRLGQFLKQQMDSLHMTGMSIAVINDGKIVYHRAMGIANINLMTKVDDSSVFEACSLSKTVFTYFVMKTIEKGLLDLDKPLYQYLPYPDIQKDDRYKLITTRIVLCHTTGFPDWRYFDDPDSSLHVKYGDLYLKFTPGTKFSYSGEGFQYLSEVIASLYNKSLKNLEGVFQQEVAIPLGMEHAYYCWDNYLAKHRASGHVKGKPSGKKWPVSFPTQDSSTFGAAGCLYTDAVSYAKLLIAIMDHTGLKKSTVEEMLKEQAQVPKEDDLYSSGTTSWGLGVGIEHTRYGIRYKHGGNNGDFQSGYMFYKERKNGYVFFTNCDKGAEFNKNLETFLTE